MTKTATGGSIWSTLPKYSVPKKEFTASAVSPTPDLFAVGPQMARWKDRQVIEDGVLSSTDLIAINWMELHSYMVLRFGPRQSQMVGKNWRYAPCGEWILDTPDTHVFVAVIPQPSALPFEPLIDLSGFTTSGVENVLSAEGMKKVTVGYRATLIDLLRPISVDDIRCNVHGVVTDNALMNLPDVVTL